MKNILKPLNKNKILSIPLGLTAAAALVQIHKKSYCLRNNDTDNIKWGNERNRGKFKSN